MAKLYGEVLKKIASAVAGALYAFYYASREHGRTIHSRIQHPGVYFGPRANADATSSFEGPNRICDNSLLLDVRMGRHTYCACNCQIMHCEIGRFCSIGPEVFIGAGIHPTSLISTFPGFYSRNAHTINFRVDESIAENAPVVIGNDVWIGGRVIVFGGITVGDGAIIGGGSLVTKDVEPYTIVGGVPARLIRKRFSDESIKQLLDYSWWNKDDEFISAHANFFVDPEEFFSFIKQVGN
jgi:acetyltransferase-like isoleucine patch superfamily enzyme